MLQLQLQSVNSWGSQRAQYDTQIKAYQAIAAKQEREKGQLKHQAEEDQKTYDALNFHDDRFDLRHDDGSLSKSFQPSL